MPRILGPAGGYPPPVNPTLGWTLAAGGMVLLAVTWVRVQHDVAPLVADALTVVAAATAAVGGLLVLTDVTVASWILAPLCCGAGAWLHRRVLFRGAGPFRT